MKAKTTAIQPVIWGIVSMLLIFLFEMVFRLVAGTALYVLVALFMLWRLRTSGLIVLVGIVSTLFLLSIFLLPFVDAMTDPAVSLNRMISIPAVWLAVFFTIRFRKLYELERSEKLELKSLIAHNNELAESNLKMANAYNEELERKVQQRTAELECVNAELEKSQAVYRSMARHFPDGFIGVMNRDLKYVLVDGKGLGELGLDPLSAMGDRVFDNIHAAITSYAEGALKKVFDGESVSFDVEIEGRYYNVSSVPIEGTDSAVRHILVVVKNISGHKSLERELVKTLEKEKELNILKSRFVTMASHEFRTPLTTILSSAFLLENYTGRQLETEKKKHLDRIKRAVHGLTELLNDFLSLGKLEEGVVHVSYKPVHLKQFGEDVLQEVLLVKKEYQRIVFEFEGEDAEVLMDKQLLRHILLNLLSNAIKYSPVQSTIGLTMAVTPKHLKLKVTDQGIGIPEDEQKFIFKRFFRANNTTEIQGTGLGLNIVRRYVKLLKGRIDFQSRLNKGTVFTVAIPIEHLAELDSME